MFTKTWRFCKLPYYSFYFTRDGIQPEFNYQSRIASTNLQLWISNNQLCHSEETWNHKCAKNLNSKLDTSPYLLPCASNPKIRIQKLHFRVGEEALPCQRKRKLLFLVLYDKKGTPPRGLSRTSSVTLDGGDPLVKQSTKLGSPGEDFLNSLFGNRHQKLAFLNLHSTKHSNNRANVFWFQVYHFF